MLYTSYAECFTRTEENLLVGCQAILKAYNDKQYNLLNRPGTKGLQRATRLEWVFNKLREQKGKKNNLLVQYSQERHRFTAQVFIELYKFYEKEEADDKSRLHNNIYKLLLDFVGVKPDMPIEAKDKIYSEHVFNILKDKNCSLTTLTDEDFLKLVNTQFRKELKLTHPRFKYKAHELIDQCREQSIGHQNANSYHFWNKPGGKGKDRAQALNQFLDELGTRQNLTEEEAFIEIFQFYKADQDSDPRYSRLRTEIGKILLRMLGVDANAKDDKAWHDIDSVYKRFNLNRDQAEGIFGNVTDDILQAVHDKFISEKPQRAQQQLTSSGTGSTVDRQFPPHYFAY